jgi:hypothetical protein
MMRLNRTDSRSFSSLPQWLAKTGRHLMRKQDTAYRLTVTDWVNGLAAIPKSMTLGRRNVLLCSLRSWTESITGR